MALPSECRCLPSELHKYLTEAVEKLRKSSLGDMRKVEKERKEKLKEPLEKIAAAVKAMEAIGTPMPPELVKQMTDKIYASVPMSEKEKTFRDLEQYLESCKCPEDVVIDWRKFPYGVKERGRPFAKKVAALPTDVLEQITGKILTYNKKFKSVLDDAYLFSQIKNKYPNERDITAGNVRKSLVELGVLSEVENKEWYELNKKLIDAGGPDLIFRADNEFLNIRKSKGFIISPKKEFGFGRGK